MTICNKSIENLSIDVFEMAMAMATTISFAFIPVVLVTNFSLL